MKKQQENAQLSLVYAMLKMRKLAREFLFDSEFQFFNLGSITEHDILLLSGNGINMQIDIKGN